MDHVVHHHEPSNIGSEVAEAVEDRYEDTEVVIPANFKAHWSLKYSIHDMYKNREREMSVCVALITNEGR